MVILVSVNRLDGRCAIGFESENERVEIGAQLREVDPRDAIWLWWLRQI